MAARIGIFGGTFDPIHNGHIQAASAAFDQFDLDEVRFVVANDPWQKSHFRKISPAAIRLEIVKAATQKLEWATVDNCEIVRGGPSYTIDTIRGYLAKNSTDELLLIIGDDLAQTIDTWHESVDLAELVSLLVYRRSGSGILPIGWNARLIEGEPIDISSTQIRAMVVNGEPVDQLIPAEVSEIIFKNHLYI